ncbi:Putative flippase GtrA (transmembrane translocase of bactoprenol-linked glucose) [Chitinophaga sp. CF118]|uniref:GtrA family protein n=1 Tax=Chitinophaga sp. CF118 TaxID=1884367 RepID=UPI0008EAA117|nr:GtrA family protein [Chitinophaga sp. CF118]SFE01857.1 Putative flippase GtrA (transmembrane translocase of bactoprenol-linked glucose) [Chitinophaga sp. CF118]
MPVKFIKAQASSLAATGVDFLIAILLTQVIGVWYISANITGNVAGGVTNFFVNRQWVFEKRNNAISLQAVKYILVWGGNMILNAVGIWLLVNYKILPYVWAKIIVAVVIGVTYNYMIQKRFVFK